MFRVLTPIFSIIIAIAVYFVVTQPMFGEMQIVQDETNQYREAVDKAHLFNQTLQELLTKRKSFGAQEMERLEALVPNSVDEVKLLVDLEAMAERQQMLIGNISVDKPKVPVVRERNPEIPTTVTLENLSSIDISFSLIGTYDQFRSMLTDIERSLVLMEVISLSFTASESDLYQFELTVRTHGLPSLTE